MKMSSGNSDGLLEIDVSDWSDDFEMEFPPVENILTQKQPVLTVVSHASGTDENSVVNDSVGYWMKDLTGIPNITHEFLTTYFTAVHLGTSYLKMDMSKRCVSN